MNALFSNLEKRYADFQQNQISQFWMKEVTLEKAQQLLSYIRDAGKTIDDIDQRNMLADYANKLGQYIFELSQEFPLTLIESYQDSSRQRWLMSQNFTIDPFQFLDGSSDQNLSYYFYQMPEFFNRIYGELGATFVFGEDGSGKSALRNAISQTCVDEKILPIEVSLLTFELSDAFSRLSTVAENFNAIYFLIDPVKEIEWNVLRPLLEDRRLIELSEHRDYKIAFKFFLHQKFYNNTLQIPWIAERKEQIAYVLEWTETQFREMLKERLKLSSNGMVSSLAQLSDGVEDADKIVLNAANGSPRKLIAICNRLFDLHCANLDDDKSLIKQETFDGAMALNAPVLPVEQEQEFAKTISGFMNADGGVLPLDTGFDVQTITAAYVVTEHPVRNCIHSEGENMRLRIEKSPTPVYYKNLENGEHEFYIRKKQITERLDVKRAIEYIRAHFHAE